MSFDFFMAIVKKIPGMHEPDDEVQACAGELTVV
jgi:hypothetical protein